MEITVGYIRSRIIKNVDTKLWLCATYKLTCSDTVFASLVMFFIYVDIRTTISFINSLMTQTLYQTIKEIKSPQDVL